MKWIIIFENGYCGCDIEEKFEGTREEVEEMADEYLPIYAENYSHVAFDWGEEPNPEEYENYVQNCCYVIAESEDDEE